MYTYEFVRNFAIIKEKYGNRKIIKIWLGNQSVVRKALAALSR